jgi:hypothetical protein
MDSQTQIATAGNDGSALAVSEEMLQALKDEAKRVASDDERTSWTARLRALNARHCRWDGQSWDSRKHGDDQNAQQADPFEGATDMRVRYGDTVVNEKVKLVTLATLRADIHVQPMEGADAEKAQNMELVRQYLLKHCLGYQWVREIIKLAQYAFGDEPGVARMHVGWRKRETLELRRLTAAELARLYVERAVEAMEQVVGDRLSVVGGEGEDREGAPMGANAGAGGASPPGADAAVGMQAEIEVAGEAFAQALVNGELEEPVVAAMVQGFFPDLTERRAQKIAKQMRADGVAEFPERKLVYDGPEIFAEALNQDFYVPTNTPEWQRARMWFRPMWLSRTEVQERAREEAWSETFVEKLLGDGEKSSGQEGKGLFKQYRIEKDGAVNPVEDKYYTGLFEVVYGYFQSATEDGIAAKYVIPFHGDIDEAAHDRRLVEVPGGKWPGHVVQREVLTDRMIDSRGVSALAAPYQDLQKLYVDTLGDHAQLTLPPVISKNRRDQGALYIRPLEEIKLRRDGEVDYMRLPEAPQSAVGMLGDIRTQGDQYFGRANGTTVPEWMKQLEDEFVVMWWLTNVAEIWKQILALVPLNMSAERLARITNDAGVALELTADDLVGEYDVTMAFEARDLDPEQVRKTMETVNNFLLAIDQEQTIERSELIRVNMRKLMPQESGRVLRRVEQAQESELEKEFQNWLSIVAGKAPARVTDGSWNYALRLQMYPQMQAENPLIYSSLPADRQALLRAHIDFLEAQAEQYGANVQIGREGARRAELGSGAAGG